MTALELRFLGELEVIRGGERLELPPSRKTRALLAYLALNPRPFRREHLCELLWDAPDDPRGSLRWSLSKLRRLVDDDDRCRIVADRSSVAFDASDVTIDFAGLQALTAERLETTPIAELEALAGRYCGHPLEGLDLPDFHEFDTWCMGRREAANQAQVRLLCALVRHLASTPEHALPHARTLVRIAPYDERLRATLIRLLAAAGRKDLAERQFQIGQRLLKEGGAPSTGELERAWFLARSGVQPGRVERDPPPVAPSRGSEAPAIPAASDGLVVGRDAEIEHLATGIRQAFSSDRATVFVVTGDPGIGKSTLLARTSEVARQSGALLLEAAAYESESIRPFAVWIDALRKIEPEALAAVFAPGDQANRDRLFLSLAERIAARLEAQPVALVFDDLHWGDESSAAALHYVLRMHRDRPLVAILAAREDELRDNVPMLRALRELRQAGLVQDVRLGPLTEPAVRELISTRSPTVDGDRLSQACGGNPLLAIELARAEAAGDSVHSLSELVQERLARFDVEGGDVLRWAAVLAPRIDADTLARITGVDFNRIGEVLETAARQSMLTPAERGFRFSHELIARSIYAAISPARRRTMHRRVAESLERDTALEIERAADLAHHAAQSGDPGLAARAMVSAGRLCLRFFANEEARSLARKGLQWVERLPAAERICLTLELHEILLAAGPLADWQAAAQEYAALAEQALDHGALSHARRGYFMASYVHWRHGHWAGAHEEILQAERVTRSAGDEEHVVGMAEAARCLALLERDLTHADAMLMEAQALASRKHISYHAIPAALGMLRYHENQLDEAVDLFKEARTLARSAGDRISEFQAHEYLAMIEFERGCYEAARAHAGILLELSTKLREGSELPFAHAFAGLCHYAIGDGVQALDASLDALRAADAKHRLAYTLSRAGLLDLERRRPADAERRAREALAYAEALQRPSEIVMARVILARAREALDDTAGVEAQLEALAVYTDLPLAGWARARLESLRSRPAEVQGGA